MLHSVGMRAWAQRQGTLTKHIVEELDFLTPVAVRPLLALGEEERLARVEASGGSASRSGRSLLVWSVQRRTVARGHGHRPAPHVCRPSVVTLTTSACKEVRVGTQSTDGRARAAGQWMRRGRSSHATGTDSPVDAGEAAVLSGNLEDAVQAEEVEGGAASLEDDDMGGDKEGRLAVM